ncbi:MULTISPECIES: polysaccharide biosynthesis protein [Prochlorococcus]|uniref:Nucleotide-diphosphate-sugar epimerase, membrane associated n=1 Tax=Prochlorococcus marinus (strain SARG / CCMP1375 / SS120) TaxID=167539 RepID=Q7VCR1_PROMA|nr:MULTISPECIES: nucleoside-diphosphate sugar epimerase/dehydratase [Prochlorococcus]AAP99723.1 Nucleotide-diphosphate-sugar epimerase, membrane associated [Prochlorococcus marinus subsp. marinus str. CCMP1375]
MRSLFNHSPSVYRLGLFQRRACLFAIDICTVFIAYISVNFLLVIETKGFPWILINSLCLAPPIFYFTGQYKSLTKYLGSKTIYIQATRNFLLVALTAIASYFYADNIPSFNFWVLYWFFLTVFIAIIRVALRDLLLELKLKRNHKLPHIAIYGAGEAGAQLAASIRLSKTYLLKFFIDDDSELWNRDLNGTPIIPPSLIKNYITSLDKIFIAIPTISSTRQKEILGFLKKYNLEVSIIPTLSDITSGRARVDQLRPVAIEDLLGREIVPPNKDILGDGIQQSVVCVTGAGGSIGSELCRQIIKLNPSKLILFDHSELNLYNINQELLSDINQNQNIYTVLGSVTNLSLVRKVFTEHQVDFVFHAAAYKHVPLVESNPLSGLVNNVLSTRNLCNLSRQCEVKKFVLISTDKAVRPTNVMGATKRLAEIVVQANAEEAESSSYESNSGKTCFSIVRFGNVLASSGSVVPLFQKQIAAGGPITITHPDVIRYFMTIREAALLVLQASVLAEGGDVFLLDMGEPQKIRDLAEQLVKLSGLSIKSDINPKGDIEMVFTGLRPGEKLFEELLIDASSEPTKHPLIYRAIERFIPSKELWPQLDSLEVELNSQNEAKSIERLIKLVPEFQFKPKGKSN